MKTQGISIRPGWMLATACATLFVAGTLAKAQQTEPKPPAAGAPKAAEPAAKDDQPKAKPAADGPAKPADANARDDATAAKPEPGKEIEIPPDPDTFLDPRAKNLMANEFPELFRTDSIVPDILTRSILAMANGTTNIDRASIARFIHHEAAQLSSRKNIEALLAPPGAKLKAGEDPLAIGQAAVELIEPLRGAANAKNQGFRREYIGALLAKDVMPKLLAGHLFTRTQAMLVLSKTADEQVLDTLLAALGDENQPLSVKILAANGISNITQQGRRPFESTRGFPIARAVLEFLQGDAKMYWPAQIAALEAIGSLRLSTVNQNNADFEIAVAAAKLLEDPKGRLDVRAWAAWAVGMTRIVGPRAGQFNFSLVAHDMGELAVTMGSSILAANIAVNNTAEKVKAPPDLANDLTALLYYRLHRGLTREPEIADSGLLSSLTSTGISERDRTTVREIAKGVQDVTIAAVELSRAAGSQVAQRQKELQSKIVLLKKILAQSPPAKRTLVLKTP